MSDAHRHNRKLADAMTRIGAAVALTLLAGQALAQSTNPNDADYDPVAAGEAAQAELQRLMQEAERQNDRSGAGGVSVSSGPRDGFASGGMAMGESGSRDLDVAVSEYQTVDMKLVDEDLIVVLNTLAEQARVNIIASRDVNATVSANLYGVTFEEALDALLHVNGYAWERRGNFIYVMTRDEWLRREQEARTKEHRVVQLSYLNATDAAQFVEPLLSEVGEIVANAAATEFALAEGRPSGAEDFALESTLVVYDYPEHIEEIVLLLESLDTRPSQVLVEATILQTSLTEANAFGVDFAIVEDINFIDFFDFGGPLGAPGALSQLFENNVAPIDNEAAAISSRAGNFAGPANFRASILAEDVAFFIRALDEVSDTTILSNPKILTLNRQPARVLVGRKLGYLNTTSTETATTQTVEFLDTGTQLSFRPFISKDGMIRLELTPRVSEGVIRAATDATGAAVTIPDEITQELTTNVIVPDGATVVLGGLFKETTELSRSQVPFFGDIPLVGAAFRGHDDATDRQEIIFMITPTVMNDKKMLDQGERGVQHIERVRVGSRQGLLPWSRDKQTRNLNVEAERYIREGKLDKAMWNLSRSLELNANQPDVRRLREEISNQVDYWPSRSVLDHVFDDEEPIHFEAVDDVEELSFNLPVQPAPVAATDQPDSDRESTDGENIVTNADPDSPVNSDVVTTNNDAGVESAEADEIDSNQPLFDDEIFGGNDPAIADNQPPFADPFQGIDPVNPDPVEQNQAAALDQPQPNEANPSAANEPVAINASQPAASAPAQPQADMSYVDPFAQFVRSERSSRILRHDPVVGGEARNSAGSFHDPVLDGSHFPAERQTTQLDVAGSPEAAVERHVNSTRRPYGYIPEPLAGPAQHTDERYNVPNHTAYDNTLSRFPDAHRKLDRILAGMPGLGLSAQATPSVREKELVAASTGPFAVRVDPALASPFRFVSEAPSAFALPRVFDKNAASVFVTNMTPSPNGNQPAPGIRFESIVAPPVGDTPRLTTVDVQIDND